MAQFTYKKNREYDAVNELVAYTVMDADGKVVGTIEREEFPNPRAQAPDVEWVVTMYGVDHGKPLGEETLKAAKWLAENAARIYGRTGEATQRTEGDVTQTQQTAQSTTEWTETRRLGLGANDVMVRRERVGAEAPTYTLWINGKAQGAHHTSFALAFDAARRLIAQQIHPNDADAAHMLYKRFGGQFNS